MGIKQNFALPFAGYTVIQLAKFRKLSLSYELFITILISFPYLCMMNPTKKVDACTQTNMEMEFIESNMQRKKNKEFGALVIVGAVIVGSVSFFFRFSPIHTM
jgi:hypothetical protein